MLTTEHLGWITTRTWDEKFIRSYIELNRTLWTTTNYSPAARNRTYEIGHSYFCPESVLQTPIHTYSSICRIHCIPTLSLWHIFCVLNICYVESRTFTCIYIIFLSVVRTSNRIWLHNNMHSWFGRLFESCARHRLGDNTQRHPRRRAQQGEHIFHVLSMQEASGKSMILLGQ